MGRSCAAAADLMFPGSRTRTRVDRDHDAAGWTLLVCSSRRLRSTASPVKSGDDETFTREKEGSLEKAACMRAVCRGVLVVSVGSAVLAPARIPSQQAVPPVQPVRCTTRTTAKRVVAAPEATTMARSCSEFARSCESECVSPGFRRADTAAGTRPAAHGARSLRSVNSVG